MKQVKIQPTQHTLLFNSDELHVLNKALYLLESTKFDDDVWVDSHNSVDIDYDMDLGALMNKEIKNILVGSLRLI